MKMFGAHEEAFSLKANPEFAIRASQKPFSDKVDNDYA